MAEENKAAENKEVEKKEKKGLPLMSILTIVLVVLTLFISVFSLLKVMSATTAIENFVKESEQPEEIGEIPLEELETIDFKDKFILVYNEEDGSTHNVVLNISIGVQNNDDTSEDVTKIRNYFDTKEKIIRTGVEKLLRNESYTIFNPENQEVLEEKLVEHFRGRFGSNAVVDVYCNGILTSDK